MAKFLALTSRGLNDVLERELQSLDLKVLKKQRTSILFESNWKGCYRANLCLRSATRVLLPILDFVAYDFDELYNNCKKHDFTKYITPEQTLAVDLSLSDSGKIRNQNFAMLKIKDAIVDQFNNKFGSRPDIDSKSPDLKVVVRIVNHQVSISIDTSGESLSLRGYRKQTGLAPLREHLAAGLLLLSQWKPEQVLVDPMVGSGTLLTEAALMAMNVPPGFFKKKFSFQKFKNYKADDFNQLCNELEAKINRDVDLKLYGFDVDPRAMSAAQENIAEAELEDKIQLQQMSVSDLKNRFGESGMVIVNPPYGERIGADKDMEKLYQSLSQTLKTEFKGWQCWLLSGNAEITQSLGMRADKKYNVFNANIECRFLQYQIH